MGQHAGSVHVEIEHVFGHEFRVRFDDATAAELMLDEPPSGHGQAPEPERLLAAAIGCCLSATLLRCLERARVPVVDLTSHVSVEMVLSQRRRLDVQVCVDVEDEAPADVRSTACDSRTS